MIENLLDQISIEYLPKHIGIILDGNGRWAKKRFMPRAMGHREGMKRVVDIVEKASDLGIKYLSLYAFSTENWKRPEDEVNALMDILVYYVKIQLDKLNKNNVKINALGDINELPPKAFNAIKKAIYETKDNTGMVLNIGLNYGGRDEIVHGVKKIVEYINLGKLDIENLNSENFNNYLYTKDQPDLDLLIRPGGEKRISNFMLYQLAYAELYYTNCLWPDFDENQLYKAIVDYQSRNRRYGGLNE